MANLTFDPVLETRYFDEKLIFLAILHYINRRIRSAFSKYFLLCSRKLMCLNQGSDWWSEQRFKRYSHFKFWTNILTLGRKLYENPTIYMQYGYDGFKISIKNKVNSKHSLKSYQSINNWWEKNYLIMCVDHASLKRKKQTANHMLVTTASKMSTSSEFVPKIDTQPYLTQFSWPAQFLRPEQAWLAEIRLDSLRFKA